MCTQEPVKSLLLQNKQYFELGRTSTALHNQLECVKNLHGDQQTKLIDIDTLKKYPTSVEEAVLTVTVTFGLYQITNVLDKITVKADKKTKADEVKEMLLAKGCTLPDALLDALTVTVD